LLCALANFSNENSPPNEFKLNADFSTRETNNCLNQIERIRRAIFRWALALAVVLVVIAAVSCRHDDGGQKD